MPNTPTTITASTTPVELQGEQLDEIIWQGRQWAVSAYGIECRNGKYHIEASRLSEMRGDLPNWPLHMVEKNWVDMDDFCTAFLVALAIYPQHNAMTRQQVMEGVRKAIKTYRRYGELTLLDAG